MVKNIYKIAISGKARSGKDTVANIITKCKNCKIDVFSFAAPIKNITEIMFPQIPKTSLWGDSKLRDTIVDGLKKDNKNVTIRDILLDIGKLGRSYHEDTWVNSVLNRIDDSIDSYDGCLDKKHKLIQIISDLRFKNEFIKLKQNNFKLIRVKRKDHLKSTDQSEVEQDEIPDSDFDFIINNNGTLKELKEKINIIMKEIFK